jgi:hypothetical protein
MIMTTKESKMVLNYTIQQVEDFKEKLPNILWGLDEALKTIREGSTKTELLAGTSQLQAKAKELAREVERVVPFLK